MVHCAPAGHRLILVVDVEGFGDRRRTDADQVAVRAGMYQALARAFDLAGISWTDCGREDRGDGVFVLAPEGAREVPFVDVLPLELATALAEHNAKHSAQQRIRMRMALHAGHVRMDEYGATSASVNLAFRLLDSQSVKDVLATSTGVLVLAVSDSLLTDVVRRSGRTDPSTFRPVRVRVKETSAVVWIGRPDRPYPPDPDVLTSSPPVERSGPRQLPMAPATFAGREPELAELNAAFGAGTSPGRPVVVSTLAGTGGMGKTWLALHWAHKNVDRFPDGQLFVDLRGFSPDGQPMSAGTALRGFLDALGVDPAQMPADPHAQAARYRSLVANKRLLVLLDNAVDAEQVVPLLPGGANAAVLVTSRSHLPGLVAAHGARPVHVDVLSDQEARTLLAVRLGADRAAAEGEAIAELVACCGGYPLALSIVAGRAQVRPDLRLAQLAADLRDAALTVLDEDDPAASLPTVLSWSYKALDTEQARAFSLLGIAPGPDISLLAAAAACDQQEDIMRHLLDELERASLIVRHTPDRYRMHDLVRLFATGRAEQDLACNEREAALRRLTDHYLHTAYAGDRLIFPHRIPIEPIRLTEARQHNLPPDKESALTWFDAEHANLLAVQQRAAEHEWDATTWQLAWALTTFHYRRGHLQATLDAWRTGLGAAGRLGDSAAVMSAHRHIGDAHARLDQHEEALAELDRARTLADRLGDVRNSGRCRYDLANLWEKLGDDRRALEHANAAMIQFRAIDLPVWVAAAMTVACRCESRLGHHDRARELGEAALALFGQVDNPDGIAHALDGLGHIAHQADRHTDAIARYEEALALSREVGHVYLEADVLDHLAVTFTALGWSNRARGAWQKAIERYDAQGRTTDRDRVRRHLEELDRSNRTE